MIIMKFQNQDNNSNNNTNNNSNYNTNNNTNNTNNNTNNIQNNYYNYKGVIQGFQDFNTESNRIPITINLNELINENCIGNCNLCIFIKNYMKYIFKENK